MLQVTFVADAQYQPPLHPHVYSNGHICASILGTSLSVQPDVLGMLTEQAMNGPLVGSCFRSSVWLFGHSADWG
jgi:hypothetical protein